MAPKGMVMNVSQAEHAEKGKHTAEIDTKQRTSMDGAFIELAAKCGRDQPGRKGDQERTGGEQKQSEQAQP